MSSANIFHQAIVNRDLKTIKRILKEEAGWKPVNDEGETILHLAFKCKHRIFFCQGSIIETLECFLSEGFSIDLKNAVGRTVLFLAVKNRLRRVIDFLVEHGANLNALDQNGNTIVHFLIEDQSKNYSHQDLTFQKFIKQDHIDTMTWLLSKDVRVDCQNNDGKSAFILAAEKNLIHVIPTLLEYMNDVNGFDDEGCTIIESFFKAKARSNDDYHDYYSDVRVVEFLLLKGVSVDHVDNNGNIFFHTYLRSYNRYDEIMKFLLQHYSKVNAQDQDGNTALHLIISNSIALSGQPKLHTLEAVHTLLSKGANVHLKNKAGDTAVRLAIRVKNFEVMKALLEFGADVSPSTNSGALFLHDISSVPSIEDEMWAPMVDTLVQAGWNVNEVRPDDQLTPLMEACRSRCPVIAQKLIDNGANVNYVEKQDLMQPIHMAMVSCRNRDANTAVFFEMLSRAGAKLNVKNKRGQTALHLVPFCGYSTMNKLLQMGAHVDVRDNAGRLPLHEAVKKGDNGAIKALLQFGAELNDKSVLRELNKDALLSGEDYSIMIKNRTDVYLTQQWLKLKAANLPVIDDFADLTMKNYLQEFYIECLREVETLKRHHLNDRTTLYDLLHMDVHIKYVFMANNEKLKELVESPMLKTNFPKYRILILACYNKAVARYPLIESAERAWDYLTGIKLPDCVERILVYLENEDLRPMAEEEGKGTL